MTRVGAGGVVGGGGMERVGGKRDEAVTDEM